MFKVNFEVRDNEIDIQGIVNNANYLIYMAHARHKFLDKIGINFATLAKNQQNLLLISSQIEFKKPLYPDDKFYVSCELVPVTKLRFAFNQEIRRINTDELIATASNIGTCINSNTGRPVIPDELNSYLNQHKS